jgi:hypothetical protein
VAANHAEWGEAYFACALPFNNYVDTISQ